MSPIYKTYDENSSQFKNNPEASVLIMAGEASGDYHAAALVRETRKRFPNIRFSGIGGEKLEKAGMKLLLHYREINTIGFSGGLTKFRRVLSAYSVMKSELRSGLYSAFIPVDFPDVNMRLCKIAKKANVRVCYYISPQVWAWRKRRIFHISSNVDRMMTIFPFEEKMYRDVGVHANFVGHTMVRDIPGNLDRYALRSELGLMDSRKLVTLAPGSRSSEISRVLPVMLDAAKLHIRKYPDTQFVIPLAGPHLRNLIEGFVVNSGLDIKILESDASRIMAASDSGLVASGTATLQAALARMPHAVVYIIDNFTWILATKVLLPLIMDPDIHVAIANMLSIKSGNDSDSPIDIMLKRGFRIPCLECGRPLFVPEILQHNATPKNLAFWLGRFRSEPALTAAIDEGFVRLREMLESDPSRPSASDIVCEMIQESVSMEPRV
jgi:lipid-A-disaccharide synthase